MPERYRRATTSERIESITAVFRASFPEVPAEVVAGHLRGERILSLTRTARRIIDLEAVDYDKAVALLIACQLVTVAGVRADDFDDEAVAEAIERRIVPRSSVMLGRVISCLANDQPLPRWPRLRTALILRGGGRSRLRALPENPHRGRDEVHVVRRSVMMVHPSGDTACRASRCRMCTLSTRLTTVLPSCITQPVCVLVNACVGFQ